VLGVDGEALLTSVTTRRKGVFFLGVFRTWCGSRALYYEKYGGEEVSDTVMVIDEMDFVGLSNCFRRSRGRFSK